jgi:hypothetical protein
VIGVIDVVHVIDVVDVVDVVDVGGWLLIDDCWLLIVDCWLFTFLTVLLFSSVHFCSKFRITATTFYIKFNKSNV